MPEVSILAISPHNGGWLVAGDDAPIGFIDAEGSIHTPSGAAYAVKVENNCRTLVGAGGRAVVTLRGDALTDETSALIWRLRDDWQSVVRNGTLDLNEVWALPYTLEDAQGTVPNRVKLLLAWVVTRGAG
jgi:hypothetical protein